MIILDTVNKSLEVILSGVVTTTQLPYTAHYVDINQSTFACSAVQSADGTTNSGSAVTMVAVPGATTSRQVKAITIYNADTAAATVTVRLNNNGTTRILWKGTLAVGDTLVYGD